MNDNESTTSSQLFFELENDFQSDEEDGARNRNNSSSSSKNGWVFQEFLTLTYEEWKKNRYQYSNCHYICNNKSRNKIFEKKTGKECYSRYNLNCNTHENCEAKVYFQSILTVGC